MSPRDMRGGRIARNYIGAFTGEDASKKEKWQDLSTSRPIPYDMPIEDKHRTVVEFFPSGNAHGHTKRTPVEVTPFSLGQLETALSKFKQEKAPGMDGIPAEALHKVGTEKPE
ncbi:hypothetical protein JTB14_018799 [Gonioctena quinquepunctata]|nr:hypothetical protein JTB14_018799 [Gonioctena quinquepunctata]